MKLGLKKRQTRPLPESSRGRLNLKFKCLDFFGFGHQPRARLDKLPSLSIMCLSVHNADSEATVDNGMYLDVENEALGDIATNFTCTTEKVVRVFFISFLIFSEFSFSDELK